MADTPVADIIGLIENAREVFRTGVTKPLEYRKAQIKGLLRFLEEKKKEIYDVMSKDLGRHEQETDLGEIAAVDVCLRDMTSNLKNWSQPRPVSTPLLQVKGLSTSHVVPEPKGVVLVISPWNYPVQLPLIGIATAIAAGNVVVLKPSEVSEHSTKFLVEELPKFIDSQWLKIVTGGVPQSTEILKHRFDHILYTGNGTVGRIVMRAAAEHLTPVTLELGGKSPVVVDKDVDLEVAARRVVWGKCFNTGQSCIGCDYVLVHEKIKDKFVDALKEAVTHFYGADPKTSTSFGRIINQRQWQRLNNLITESRREDANSVIVGGDIDEATRYIAPTIISAKPDSAIMRDEIFGPLLPILSVSEIDDAINFINDRPKPLALYVFSKSSHVWQSVIDHTSSGGLVVNDTLMHYTVPSLPFGGVGESGIGAYHGQVGFDTLSHLKSVLNKTTWFDLDVRYPPYSEQKIKQFNRMNI